MAFSDLEKRKHKTFLEKLYAGARANIEEKPYGASSSAFSNWRLPRRCRLTA